ncbi:MAG TPA: ATP-dependent DNA ligase [Mycobacteriales bacterium]|nr:ATP-dependent DNA ligase [Mycobacteriales bacterium]
MLFVELARTSAAVAATAARNGKVALLAETLRTASYDEVGIVVSYLSGELRQRRTGVGYRSLTGLPSPAAEPSLSVLDVDAAFERMSECAGAGSQGERARLLSELFAAATADEQRLLVGLIGGDLRQGALESVVADAAAKAAGVPTAALRRAAMLCGALPPVATAVLQHGASALEAFRLEVGRPVQPMLASTAADVAAALEKVSPAAVEWKLDGIRVQVHRDGDVVRVFTRTLDDITARVPDVVADALSLPVRTAVLDGEAIALGPDGRPRPFQVTSSRAATHADTSGTRLTSWYFDLLHVDGDDLLGLPASARAEALARVVPEGMRVPRLVTADVAEATAFADDAVARGHEGVVVKSLDASYDAGRRGAGWLKVKPRHTLDLVVLAAEWGHGRRKGWLSNLHLGARDPETGGHVMLGKTFKGLTDEMLTWQTERLLSLEVDRNDWQVFVRPELLVEIAFDGVQTSPRYPGGVALRFARVLRYRDDKPVSEADTIEAVRVLHRP